MISVQRQGVDIDPAEQTADGVIGVRLGAAVQRDAEARAHDLNALARDQAAAERDSAQAQHAATLGDAQAVLDITEQRSQLAQSAAARRDRASAMEDRIAAARDRTRAALDRFQALADIEALTRDLAMAETDDLTGATNRGPGLADLEQEVRRCRREDGMLAIACVDVVGLKAVNDTDGHGAGDAILERVVTQMRADLRSYDLIIRLGDDDFLCAMPNLTETEARQRVSQIAGALASTADPVAIRTGFAHITGTDTVEALIARAEREFTSHRREGALATSGS
jgi:diguanylate cyclase (GGDEF)-like protein